MLESVWALWNARSRGVLGAKLWFLVVGRVGDEVECSVCGRKRRWFGWIYRVRPNMHSCSTRWLFSMELIARCSGWINGEKTWTVERGCGRTWVVRPNMALHQLLWNFSTSFHYLSPWSFWSGALKQMGVGPANMWGLTPLTSWWLFLCFKLMMH